MNNPFNSPGELIAAVVLWALIILASVLTLGGCWGAAEAEEDIRPLPLNHCLVVPL